MHFVTLSTDMHSSEVEQPKCRSNSIFSGSLENITIEFRESSVSNYLINKYKTFNQFKNTSLQSYNGYKNKIYKFVLNPRKLLFGSLIGYVALRHILPKKDMTYYRYDGTGDTLIGYNVINCILFDQVINWYDGTVCAPYNSYYWRRINYIYNDYSRK